ncbi:hypothetical protein T4E_7491 [Trichinella pseudospiralis]|uniref:Uncharacterized protein n=1 Tax=Trichinella pseudospiralis TaxID=6337 RepID=A0A0V0XZS4_TRIPS|nr:hypothetical protein T4E_7491 [Trichinella pseudospiralis]
MLTVFPLSMKRDLKSKQNPVPMLVSGFDLNDFRGNGSVCNGNQCDDQHAQFSNQSRQTSSEVDGNQRRDKEQRTAEN